MSEIGNGEYQGWRGVVTDVDVRALHAPSVRLLLNAGLESVAEPIELDLRQWQGVEPIELLGGVHFPTIGELPYLLTLGAHGFYWFRLAKPADHEESM